ncbi:hypothetical protein [Desulfitobacterium metallireducens]|nr:hypothetical protein [Desulfitobacterium metallireducens]
MKKLKVNIKDTLSDIKRFKEKNKAIFLINVISIIIVVMINVLSLKYKVKFLYADVISNILLTLSLAFISSTIFFIIQMYIPNLHKNKLREKDEAEDLIHIMNIMQDMHGYIQLWNFRGILEDKEPLERFDIAVKYLSDSYEEVINEIRKLKNNYLDICSRKTYDLLTDIQRDTDFKIFKRLSSYRSWKDCKDLVFTSKAKDVLMKHIINFQKLEDGWLVEEDSKRIMDEFEYRHISLNGMMCNRNNRMEWIEQ